MDTFLLHQTEYETIWNWIEALLTIEICDCLPRNLDKQTVFLSRVGCKNGLNIIVACHIAHLHASHSMFWLWEVLPMAEEWLANIALCWCVSAFFPVCMQILSSINLQCVYYYASHRKLNCLRLADLMRSALEFGLFDAVNKICTLFKAYLHPSSPIHSPIVLVYTHLNFTSHTEMISCTPVLHLDFSLCHLSPSP